MTARDYRPAPVKPKVGQGYDHYFCEKCYPDAEKSICGIERHDDVQVAYIDTVTCAVCKGTDYCPECES